MKTQTIVWIACALLVLSACSREEPAPAAEEPAPAVEEGTAVEESADEALDESGEEETVEVVEESAAEPEEAPEEAIVLEAPDETAATPVRTDWKYSEGEHYSRLVPTQPTVGGADKIEVAEFFWYGCPHCYDLEPFINSWAEDIPANSRFVRIPAMWNGALRVHAQLYYTEEVLVRNGKITEPERFRATVFSEFHDRGNQLLSQDAIMRLFANFGVSAEDFTRTWSSFEVAQKMRIAEDLARRYAISSVPTMVVNGKYRAQAGAGMSYGDLIELVDELVERESIR